MGREEKGDEEYMLYIHVDHIESIGTGTRRTSSRYPQADGIMKEVMTTHGSGLGLQSIGRSLD